MIKIWFPHFPIPPHLWIDASRIPSSWYGDLARCYFRDWEPAPSATVRIEDEDADRSYTFEVAIVEERTIKVSGVS